MDQPDFSPSTAPRLLRLSPQDNVAVAAVTIEPGEQLTLAGQTATAADPIVVGHKLAVAPIAAGERVIKYGAPIGSATRDIAPGEHVHTHNMKSDYLPTYTLDGQNPYIEGA